MRYNMWYWLQQLIYKLYSSGQINIVLNEINVLFSKSQQVDHKIVKYVYAILLNTELSGLE